MNFSKSDIRGYCLLAFVILLIVGYRLYQNYSVTNPSSSMKSEVCNEKEITDFVDGIKHAQVSSPKNDYTTSFCTNTLFPFDPNTADSMTLRKIGFSKKQIQNIFKYRIKGGVWRSAEHFSNLYTLSREDYEKLYPYINIKQREITSPKDSIKSKGQSIPFVKKFSNDTIINLNTTDTTELKKIPGIGSYYAKRICEYGQRLGGYVSKEQLNEIENIPVNISKWFYVDTTFHPHKIAINQTDFKTLVRHPYLNYEQTKVIVNYIRKYGAIQGWQDLSNSKYFSDKDFERLTPYFDFE